ncbi:MAG: alpha/beta fold hydrolase [Anaerolineae bacterium]|nr:alpha/beta fold hydrolase [Anaerolineae bacterium]
MYFAIALIVLIALFLTGPKVTVTSEIRPITLSNNLDEYLIASENRFDDIVPGAGKTIVWADPTRKQKTPVSIIYLHGFSACRQDFMPIGDHVAQALDANLFYTRFTGHGRTGDALAQATISDWLHDTLEALEIGQKIGDNVVIISNSTGSTLATWLQSHLQSSDAVLASIMISPNFALKNRFSRLLVWPWGHVILRLAIGPTRSWEPMNAQVATYWTNCYPSNAVLPVAGLVKLVKSIDLTAITTPILMFISPNDRVVDTATAVKCYRQFGSDTKKLVVIEDSQDPSHHILAGDIVSPNNNELFVQTIVDFLKPLID